MKLTQKIFTSTYFSTYGFVVFCCLLVLLWNNAHTKFYVSYTELHVLLFVFLVLLFATVLLIWKFPEHPLLHTMLVVSQLILISWLINFTAIFTPFTMHDDQIASWDHFLQFNLLPILQARSQYSLLVSANYLFYLTPIFALGALPIFLVMTGNPERVQVFALTYLFALLFGYALFYFFPANTSPIVVYPSHYFSAEQIQSFVRFQAIHTHRAVSSDPAFPYVGFPSFHAIWLTLITYFYRPFAEKIALTYGILLIVVTLLSGWHYLVDILAGILLAFISIILAEGLSQPCEFQ